MISNTSCKKWTCDTCNKEVVLLYSSYLKIPDGWKMVRVKSHWYSLPNFKCYCEICQDKL